MNDPSSVSGSSASSASVSGPPRSGWPPSAQRSPTPPLPVTPTPPPLPAPTRSTRWPRAAIIVVLLLLTCVYVMHIVLRAAYYRRCQADLIKVVLMRRSGVCGNMSVLLGIIESTCDRLVRDFARAAMLASSGVVTASATTAAAAAATGSYLFGSTMMRSMLFGGRVGNAMPSSLQPVAQPFGAAMPSSALPLALPRGDGGWWRSPRAL